MKTKSQHGGKRKGAGHPATINGECRVTVRLPAGAVAILDSWAAERGSNRSAIVRGLIASARERKIIPS